jgi:hypothetical protein
MIVWQHQQHKLIVHVLLSCRLEERALQNEIKMPRSRGLLSPREFTDLVLEVACSTGGGLRFFKACVDLNTCK